MRFVLPSILCLAAIAPAAQTPSTQTFRAGVELVAVDFIAVTNDGRPVSDLRAGDIRLKVDGRVRDIRDLQFVRLADDDLEPAEAARLRLAPVAFATNRAGEAGRSIIFLFDDNTIRPGNERAAKDAAARFLDRLSPTDRVSLVTVGRVEVDLTTNHQRVRDALKYVMGHGPAGTNPDASSRPTGTAIQQAGPALGWLRTFLTGLADIDGPKTVIFVSEGAPPTLSDPSVAADYREIAKTAGAVRAQLYLIQPHNFAIDASQTSGDVGRTSQSEVGYKASEDDKLQGLEALATVTGGELFRLSAGADEVLQRVVRQSSAYYLLGFAPDTSERNGKSHQIAITVARPGVTVRARPEFTIPKPRAPVTVASMSVASMLKDPKAYREIPLRAAAYSVHATAKGLVDIVVVAESIESASPLTEVSFGLINTATRKMEIAWPAPTLSVLNGRATSGASVPAGEYRLRVAAFDRDGHRGSVEYEFAAGVAKTAASLELGDLMIGQGQADGGFEPQLAFDDRAAATGYVELRGTLPAGTALSASFELAQSAQAPALSTTPGLIGPTASPDRWSARGAIPIGSVPPGDYVVRVTVKINGEVIGRAMRALRKMGKI